VTNDAQMYKVMRLRSDAAQRRSGAHADEPGIADMAELCDARSFYDHAALAVPALASHREQTSKRLYGKTRWCWPLAIPNRFAPGLRLCRPAPAPQPGDVQQHTAGAHRAAWALEIPEFDWRCMFNAPKTQLPAVPVATNSSAGSLNATCF
jgi:hypothetical protein